MKAILVLAAVAVSVYAGALKLVLLEDAAKKDGAVCLDGSAAGYYIRRAPNSTGWSIYIQGGGWCYKESDCANRATGDRGSSANWATSRGSSGAISTDKTVNPDMYDWNLVFIPYCDGASFTGDVAEPVTVDGKKIYFRGFRILKAVFNALLNEEGMNKAENIYLWGTSAGGLSVFQHADQIARMVPATARFKASPYSGVFLKSANANGKNVYPAELKYVFNMQNSSAGAHEGCLAAKAADKKWECMFAQEILPYVKTPIFVGNSMYDEWSTRCIFTAEPVAASSHKNGNCSAIPSWTNCMKDGTKCTDAQIDEVNTKWGNQFLKVIKNSETLTRNGNGYYISSCHLHSGENSHFNSVKINGTTYQQALSKWFFNDNAPAANNQYVDCMWESDFCCNPTCCA